METLRQVHLQRTDECLKIPRQVHLQDLVESGDVNRRVHRDTKRFAYKDLVESGSANIGVFRDTETGLLAKIWLKVGMRTEEC